MTYYKARQSHTDTYTNSTTDMIWVLTEELQSFKHLKVVDLPRIHTTNIMNNEWVLASTPVTSVSQRTEPGGADDHAAVSVLTNYLLI